MRMPTPSTSRPSASRYCFPTLLPQSPRPTPKGWVGRTPLGPGPRALPAPEPSGLIQGPESGPHAHRALPGAPGSLTTRARRRAQLTADGGTPRTAPLRRLRPMACGPLAHPAAVPVRPRTPRLSHRLLWVDVNLEGLLLEGLQGDLHGADAQLRCRACSGCWPLGGVCGLAGPRGRPRSSCTREEGGGGGGLSHSPCGTASSPALAPGRAAVSATAAFPASSGRRASSRAWRQPLSLQEVRGALRDK